MDIVAWMVVRNDAYYVDMALKSVLPYVRGIYVQDQFSDDGTYEKVLEFIDSGAPIVVERVCTGTEGRFHTQYDEPKYRSLALERAEAVFAPGWLLKLDADEIYTPHFFAELDKQAPRFERRDFNGVRVAGDRFISKERRSVHPSAIEHHRGIAFVDPHTHLWRGDLGVRYKQNPAMSGYLHCIPLPAPEPLYWVEGICNIHLHRTFGPKSLPFWTEGGDKFDPSVRPFNAITMAPKWYGSPINLGCSEVANFEWPDYVLERWREWGIW